MALTGMAIFKHMPKTNCGQCGVPTCLAFAMKLAAGGASLDQCPFVSDAAKAVLAEASAPPIRGVTIGEGEFALKIGEELVMHRHEKTFFNPTGYALLIEDTEDAAAVAAKLAALKAATYERVAQKLRSNLVAVKNASGDAAKFAACVAAVAGAIEYPLVLMAEPAAIEAALAATPLKRPLLYAATKANLDAMAALAKKVGAPLAVKAATLDELGELTAKLDGMGVKDLVLDPGSRTLKETHQNLVYIRRAALKKKLRPFGYPIITFPAEETADDMMETHPRGDLHHQVRRDRRAARPLPGEGLRALRAAPEHLHRPAAADAGRAGLLPDQRRRRELAGADHDELLADLLHRLERGRGEQGADLARRSSTPTGSRR